MRYRLSVVVVAALMLVMQISPASAQSEGIELEHSSQGVQAMERYEADRSESQANYHESLQPHAKRFEQICEQHVARYTMALKREVRAVVRDGLEDQAKAIQDAIERAEGWVPAPPDGQGVHFLSDENLEVEGHEKASELGENLRKNIQKAADAYVKQTDKAFARYKVKLEAARKTLRAELNKALANARRKKAGPELKEVEDAIAVIDALPAIDRPIEVTEPAETSEVDFEFPETLDGVFLLMYKDAQGQGYKALIEFQTNRHYLWAHYTTRGDDVIKWDAQGQTIKVTRDGDAGVRLSFQDPFERTVVVAMKWTQGVPTAAFLMEADVYLGSRAGGKFAEPVRGIARSLGHRIDKSKAYEDGTYQLDLDLKTDAGDEKVDGRIRIQFEVVTGVFILTKQSRLNQLDQLEPIAPVVFQMRDFSRNRENVSWIAEKFVTELEPAFTLLTLEDGSNQVRFWWDRTKREGQEPDGTGTLITPAPN